MLLFCVIPSKGSFPVITGFMTIHILNIVKIWSKEKGERVYKGSSPHTHHIHVSIKDGMGDDISPWFKESK